MPDPIIILSHTPWWVFVLFAALVLFGVQALRPRTVSVWRLLATPTVFIAWGLVGLVLKMGAAPYLVADWLCAGAVGLLIGWMVTRLDGFHVDPAGGGVRAPGSALPLVRNLGIFAARYGLAVAMTIAPTLRGSLSPLDVAISGVSAGYFVGWTIRFSLKYRNARRPRLDTPAA